MKMMKMIYHEFLAQEYRIGILDEIPKNSIGIEIGIYQGNWSKKIIETSNPKEFWLIDNWFCQSRAMLEFLKKRKYFLENNCVLKEGNFEILYEMGEIPNQYFDWIYLDAEHSYEKTSIFLPMCFNMLKQGGVLIGDDYSNTFKGLTKAVDEFIIENRHTIHVHYLNKNVPYNNYQYKIRKL